MARSRRLVYVCRWRGVKVTVCVHEGTPMLASDQSGARSKCSSTCCRLARSTRARAHILRGDSRRSRGEGVVCHQGRGGCSKCPRCGALR